MYSHNFPSYYPNDAYVRWSFEATSDLDQDSVFIYIELESVQVDDGDMLLAAIEGETDVFLYNGSYHESNLIFPVGYLVNKTGLTIEFSTDSYNTAQGFSLELTLVDLNGTKNFKL